MSATLLPTVRRCGWCGCLLGDETAPVWSEHVVTHGLCDPCMARVEAEIRAAAPSLADPYVVDEGESCEVVTCCAAEPQP